MPYTLVAPKAKRWAYWRVRGTEFGIYLDRSTGTGDKREAQRILTAWREEAKRLSVSGPVKKSTTFASAVIAYVNAGKEARFLKPVLEHFGETPLSEIDQAAIDGAAVAIYPRATAATRNRQVYSPVSAVLRHAGVTLPLRRPKGALGTPRTDFLSQDEAFALLAAAEALHPCLGALLTFLLYTGVRLSEALRVTWPDVDFKRATAAVGKTKNGSPLTVHMPPVVVSALANLPERQGRVFALTKSGRLYHLWAEAERRAGLSLPARSAFHILRHTHGAWRRLYAGQDTSALVQTNLWKSRNAAAFYEHVDASVEGRKADLLPTPTRAKPVRHPRKRAENL